MMPLSALVLSTFGSVFVVVGPLIRGRWPDIVLGGASLLNVMVVAVVCWHIRPRLRRVVVDDRSVRIENAGGTTQLGWRGIHAVEIRTDGETTGDARLVYLKLNPDEGHVITRDMIQDFDAFVEQVEATARRHGVSLDYATSPPPPAE